MAEESSHQEVDAEGDASDNAALESFLQLEFELARPKLTRKFHELPAHTRKALKLANIGKKERKEKVPKRKRYPNEPVRPSNCWQLFCHDNANLLEEQKKKDAKNGQKATNTLKFFKPLWKAASEKVRETYTKRAAQMMAEYNEKMDEFFATHKEYVDDRKKPKRSKAKAGNKAVATATNRVEAKKKATGEASAAKVKAETSATKIVKRETKKPVAPEPDEADDGINYDD